MRIIGAVPEPGSTVEIGARLRATRKERGLTIAELAKATSLTPGFLSQLERDRTSVSLSSLARICDALGTTIGALTDRRPLGRLVRRSEMEPSVVSSPASGEHTLLTSPDERRLHATESRIPPGGTPGERLYTLPGELELVLVVAGRFELRVGDASYELEAGDTITYSPRDPHTWRNPSETDEAVVLWFAVPNPY